MFPFLKYLETSVKNRSAGILGQKNQKTRMQSGAAFSPASIGRGNPRQNQLKIPSTESKTPETRIRRLREL